MFLYLFNFVSLRNNNFNFCACVRYVDWVKYGKHYVHEYIGICYQYYLWISFRSFTMSFHFFHVHCSRFFVCCFQNIFTVSLYVYINVCVFFLLSFRSATKLSGKFHRFCSRFLGFVQTMSAAWLHVSRISVENCLSGFPSARIYSIDVELLLA